MQRKNLHEISSMSRDFRSRYRRGFSWSIIRFEVARRNESRGVFHGRTRIFRTLENRGMEKPRGRERERTLNRKPGTGRGTKDDAAKRGGGGMRVCKFTTCSACSRRGVCARIRRLSRTHIGKRWVRTVLTKFIYKGGSSGAEHNARAAATLSSLAG